MFYTVCQTKIFCSIKKNEASKNVEIKEPFPSFFISATSRGKELRLKLNNSQTPTESTYLTMGMGMAGHWEFSKSNKEIPVSPHIMLSFTTNEGEKML